MLASKDGKVVRQELVTVTTNGRQLVRVSKESLASPIDAPPVAIDPQRAAAEALSELGCRFHVTMHQDRKQHYDVHLPKELCDVFAVTFPNQKFSRRVVQEKVLPALLKLEHLNSLDSTFLDVPLTANDLSRLADAPAGSQLKWLNCRLEPSSEILAALRRFRKLEYCSFHGLFFEDDMVRFCRELPRGITSLSLYLERRSRIGERGVAAITSLPLERLILTYAQIDREFARKVATMPELREFYPVHWGTDCPLELTDEIAEELAQSKSITTLRLQGNHLTDRGLESMAKLKTLRYLVISYNKGRNGSKITQAGIDQLAAALPKCRIDWDGGVIDPKK